MVAQWSSRGSVDGTCAVTNWSKQRQIEQLQLKPLCGLNLLAGYERHTVDYVYQHFSDIIKYQGVPPMTNQLFMTKNLFFFFITFQLLDEISKEDEMKSCGENV